MIERSEIDGRSCAVQYLTRNRQPTDKANAEMVRVVFDDGDVMWGYATDAGDRDAETDDDSVADADADPPDRGGAA